LRSSVKAYIDIDGVLLTKEMTVPHQAELLIDFLLANYDCYWLTTHCRGGENKALLYLSQFYSSDQISKLSQVLPTNWLTLKTEAIDLNSDFIWLEDYPFEAEKLVLRKAGKESCLIEIKLDRENELNRVVRTLRLH